MSLEVLVTGVGRSGTGFMSKLLTMNGIPCGHELIFGAHGVTPNGGIMFHPSGNPAESSWLAAPLIGGADAPASGIVTPYTKVIHVVRNPYKVVQSIWALGTLDLPDDPLKRYVAATMPTLFEYYVSPVRRAASLALKWNVGLELNISRSPVYRVHRVEDDPRELSKFLGVEIARIPSARTNSRGPYPELPLDQKGDWFPQVRNLAGRYGYMEDLNWLWEVAR